MNRTKKLLFGSAAVLATAFGIYTNQNNTSVYTADVDERATESYKGSADYLFSMKKNPETGSVSAADILSAKKQVSAIKGKSTRTLNLEWVERGPNNIGGRTRALIFDKDNPQIMFAGGVGGGVFVTNTGGTSWFKIDNMDELDNLAVGAIVQDGEGYVYFGTGESFYQNTGTGTGGFFGAGIYKSDQKVSDLNENITSLSTMTFTKLESTWDEQTGSNAFYHVNKMVYRASSNQIFAGTAGGLKVSTDGGTTWDDAVLLSTGAVNDAHCDDIELLSNGKVFACVNDQVFTSEDGSIGSFVRNDSISLSSPSRLDIEVSPSDPNYVYVAEIRGANEQLEAMHRSTDGGVTWEVIGEGGTDEFSPMGTPGSQFQGEFDLALAVDPTDPTRMILGGVELWQWTETTAWEMIASTQQFPGARNYVHADVHVIEWHPSNNNIMYIASDGGIGRTVNNSETFETLNRGYNVTQYYSLAYDRSGNLLGGTQDNSNQYLEIDEMKSKEFYSGDGAYTAISHFEPNKMFVSSQYGNLGRSEDGGLSFETSAEFLEDIGTAGQGFSAFVTPFRLWESDFEADSIESIFAVGIKSELYLTKQALDFGKRPDWTQVDTILEPVISGGEDRHEIRCMEFSADGQVLYVGTDRGLIVRYDSLHTFVNDTVQGSITQTQIASFGGFVTVTGIGVDPNDPERVVVTLGGYGARSHIYLSTNARSSETVTGTGSFIAIDGDLPEAPVYDAMINYENSDQILAATEYGVFSNIGGNAWTAEDNGFPPVPTFMIAQQTRIDAANVGMIYAATHGRGMFETATLVGIADDNSSSREKAYESMEVYPNPTSDFTRIELDMVSSEDMTIEVYDLSGKLVKAETRRFNSGVDSYDLDVRELTKGNYVIRVSGKNMIKTAKLLKQ